MVSLDLLKQRWKKLRSDKIMFHGEKDVSVIFIPSKMAVVRAFERQKGYWYAGIRYEISVYHMMKGATNISHPGERSKTLSQIKSMAKIVAERVKASSRYDLM